MFLFFLVSFKLVLGELLEIPGQVIPRKSGTSHNKHEGNRVRGTNIITITVVKHLVSVTFSFSVLIHGSWENVWEHFSSRHWKGGGIDGR